MYRMRSRDVYVFSLYWLLKTKSFLPIYKNRRVKLNEHDRKLWTKNGVNADRDGSRLPYRYPEASSTSRPKPHFSHLRVKLKFRIRILVWRPITTWLNTSTNTTNNYKCYEKNINYSAEYKIFYGLYWYF